MKPKNSGSGRRIVCLVLVAVMLLGLISSALIIMVNAASSSEIKKELNGLRSQQAELKKEREALQAKIKENQSKTQTLVEKKSDIDQQISMTQASIDNLNEQVQQYSLLDRQQAGRPRGLAGRGTAPQHAVQDPHPLHGGDGQHLLLGHPLRR